MNVGACRLAGPCAPLPPRGTASGPGPAGTPPPPPPRPAPGLASRDRAAPGSLPSPSPGGNNLLRRRRWRRPTRALLFQRGVWLLSRRVSPSRGGPAASAKRGRGEGRGLPSPCPVPPSPPGCLCSPPPPPPPPYLSRMGLSLQFRKRLGNRRGEALCSAAFMGTSLRGSAVWFPAAGSGGVGVVPLPLSGGTRVSFPRLG